MTETDEQRVKKKWPDAVATHRVLWGGWRDGEEEWAV